MGRRVMAVVVATVLAGCGAASGGDAGSDADASCTLQLTPPPDGGPVLTLEARGFTTGHPVAGVTFVVDHAGGRALVVTDDAGTARVGLPDWDAGAVDITFYDPGLRELRSFLGVPRGASFQAAVHPPVPVGPVLTGSIVNKVRPDDQVTLQTTADAYAQTSGTAYSLDLQGLATPVDVVGTEFSYRADSSVSQTQTFTRWFRLSLPAGGGPVDVQQAQELSHLTLGGTLTVPDGGAFAGVEYPVLGVYPAVTSDTVQYGLAVGWMQSTAPAADGTIAWTMDLAQGPGLTPARTVFQLGGQVAGSPLSLRTLEGLPGQGTVVEMPAPPLGVEADAGVRLPTPFALGPARPGAVRGFQLRERFTAGGGHWTVWALDDRTTVSLPPRPAGACGLPERFPWAAPTACTDSRLPRECLGFARGKLVSLLP